MNLPKHSGTWGRPQLLLVDDETAVLRAVSRVLRTAAPQWRVHAAQNGAAALQILETTAIDVLVTDLGMAQMDGVQLLTIVERLFPEVTRVVHSADTLALETEAIRRCAAFALVKPATPERFTAVLDEALAQRRKCAGD